MNQQEFELKWKGWFRLKHEHKLERVIQELSDFVGFELHIDKYERYWKDEALLVVYLTTILQSNSKQDVFWKACSNFSKFREVSLGGPYHYNNSWAFQLSTSQPSAITSLEMLDVECRHSLPSST